MPNPLLGITAAVGIGGAAIQSGSASSASRAQQASDAAAIAEQRRQFDTMRELLQPYVDVGSPAVSGMMDLVGLSGQEAQQTAISQQEQSPFFQSLASQGENAMLQNASATGGLRGGNIQGALAQFRPQLLNQFIEQQYGRLGGLAQMGQNSAAGVGTAGMGMANQISAMLQSSGQAQAGNALAQGNIWGNALGGIGGIAAGALQPNISGDVARTIASNPSIF